MTKIYAVFLRIKDSFSAPNYGKQWKRIFSVIGNALSAHARDGRLVENTSKLLHQNSRTIFRCSTHAHSDAFVEYSSLFVIFSSFATSLFYAAPDSTMVYKMKKHTKRVTHFKIGLNNARIM
jgi:hypothetical protein